MSSFNEESEVAFAEEPVKPLIREQIRAVYPIGQDQWEGGVGEGLAFLKQLLKMYDEARIPEDEIHISAIFHSKASYMVLNDEAYRRYTKKEEANPNKDIIQELTRQGVSIEICAISMQKLGLKKEDLLPEVTVVQSTFTRAIDLQMQGYAFIAY